MKKCALRHFGLHIFMGVWLILGYSHQALPQHCKMPVARIVSVQGSVEVKYAGKMRWETVSLDDTFCPGDTIRVLENSRADITLMDRSFLRINENTTIILEGVLEEQTSLIDLLKGAAHFLSRDPGRVKVKTQYAIFGVRGTEFFIRIEENQAFMSVFGGSVLAENAIGSLVLTSGQSAVARAGMAPVLRVVARPRDAVQWALYYPPIMYDIPSNIIDKTPETIKDPRVLAQRAALLLNVGRVEQASADLDRALKLRPEFSDALALQTIIAIVRNDRDHALSLARKAVDADPESAAALIALSYARQARFDLAGARDALEAAVRARPDNALAWARLSEIQASFGDLSTALDFAQRAKALAPDLALTQTVLGFAYLAQVDVDVSKAAFEKAIILDQAAPLPRLGLGLAKIRQGDLDSGAREIEIAASLDPNNSLVRSYLGKTYYEEKRMPLDEREYQIAKELDPQDPTPWFYDAIAKQTTNRPVDALHSLQQSIALNNNRAIFRSKLLLDSDLAARSASLGRIYNDLGFQQKGLVEGWKSVNTDSTNYSAHRLLADLYAALPRHEVARVSELYQSQLLQPLNITPVQPELAESSLLILDGAGPSDLSFNEFNPLFLRNRFALQANAVAGGNDTLGNDLVQSTVWNRFSYSVGQFHYETDGFRENNDLETDIYNIFAQASLSPKTSVLGEFRYSDIDKGDLSLTFPGSFNPFLQQKETVRSTRLGLHHKLTPGSDIIASFIYQNGDLEADIIPGFFELKADLDNYLGECRYLHTRDWWNLNVGFGYSHRDETLSELLSETDADPDFISAYLYSQIQLFDNLHVTAGASADFLDSKLKNEDRDQFNPKFGVTWSPVPDTTLRAAVFRTLQRPYLSPENPTPGLEPTQVAGFNQFFVDNLGSEAWRYGIGIDQELFYDISGGAELSYRDLESALVDLSGSSPVVRRRDWDERQLRAYLYWPPLSWLALRTEYLYERFERDVSGGLSGEAGFSKLRTHKLQLGAGVFLPFGIISDLSAAYVDQDGDFVVFSNTGSSIEPGDDQFWIVDASIRYRLPKRYGIVSLEAKNLFDQSFQFQDTDPANPRILPDRLFLLKLSLSF